MNSTRHYNRRNGRARLYIAGLLSALTAVGGIVTLGATTASATTPATTSVQAGVVEAQGAANDFSYTAEGQPMARNVLVTANNFAPNTAVSVTWSSDGPDGIHGAISMTPGPAEPDGATTASATITGIPATACGYNLQVTVQGSTGVNPNGVINYSTPIAVQDSTGVPEVTGSQ